MKLAVLGILALCSFNQLFASIDTYYPQASKQALKQATNDQEIKSQLFNILDRAHLRVDGLEDQILENCPENASNCLRQRVMGYQPARVALFGQLHLEKREDGLYLKDLYCNKVLKNGSFGGNLVLGPGIIPSSKYLNCEHTWPQSHFSKSFAKEMQKSDLHHLFPTDSKANNERGSNPFGEVKGQALSNCKDSAKGPAANASSGGTYFEPPAEHKGNVARALFYFSVRYKMPIGSIEEAYLRSWHQEDPVDATERERNNQIEELQYNRNPFIDFPELVERIKNF